MQLFCILSKFGNYHKGGPLEEKKIKVLQSGRNLQDWWGPSKKQAGKWFWSLLAPCWGVSDQKRKMMQRGYPWNKKNSKCSNLDETCRTGRGHQKNKLGSVFATVLHCRWWKKSEIGQKCSRRMPRNHQKWRIFFKIDFFRNQKCRIRSLFYSEQNPLFWEEGAWQSQVHDSQECMTVKSSRQSRVHDSQECMTVNRSCSRSWAAGSITSS